jgi:DMSO reductase anchor subunit
MQTNSKQTPSRPAVWNPLAQRVNQRVSQRLAFSAPIVVALCAAIRAAICVVIGLAIGAASLLAGEPIRIAVFDVDATPPIGSAMAYQPVRRLDDAEGW